MTIIELLISARNDLATRNSENWAIGALKIDQVIHELVDLEKSLTDPIIQLYRDNGEFDHLIVWEADSCEN